MRADSRRFIGPALHDRPQVVDVACRERHNARVAVSLRHESWEERVHGPRQIFRAAGAELARRHENDVRHIRQFREGPRLQQIGRDGLHSQRGKLIAQAFVREARHRDNSFLLAAGVGGAARQPGKTRPHFAPNAEDQNVTVERGHRVDVRFAGARQYVFEFRFAIDRHAQPSSKPAIP